MTGWFRRASKPKQPAPSPAAGSGAWSGDLSDVPVLVTGAGRNIGRAIALEFARYGAPVYFVDKDPEACRSLTGEFQARGYPARGWVADVARPEEIDRIWDALPRLRTPVRVLVNNAGHQEEKRFLDLDSRSWLESFSANLGGPAHLTRRVAADLIQSQLSGSVLFLTSVHQEQPSGWPAYSTMKSALGMLVKELAVELAPHSIRVNGIAPGWVAENPQPSRYALLGRASIDPILIARAAVFLASDFWSARTTGALLTVDAGLSLYSSRVAQLAAEPPR